MFVININKNEVEPIKTFFEEKDIKHEAFYPVFSGRVDAINGEAFSRRVSKQEGEETDENSRAGVNREPNLTWLKHLPEGNEITEGEWFSGGDELEVSVFEGWKKVLDLKLGDVISIF
jgi:putative ABC transport system permease protein